MTTPHAHNERQVTNILAKYQYIWIHTSKMFDLLVFKMLGELFSRTESPCHGVYVRAQARATHMGYLSIFFGFPSEPYPNLFFGPCFLGRRSVSSFPPGYRKVYQTSGVFLTVNCRTSVSFFSRLCGKQEGQASKFLY